jgi:hypothetical protein
MPLLTTAAIGHTKISSPPAATFITGRRSKAELKVAARIAVVETEVGVAAGAVKLSEGRSPEVDGVGGECKFASLKNKGDNGTTVSACSCFLSSSALFRGFFSFICQRQRTAPSSGFAINNKNTSCALLMEISNPTT